MSSDPEESPALAALSELARDSVKRPTAAELEHGLSALRARTMARPSRFAGALRFAPIAALVLVCVALGTATFVMLRPSASVAAKAPALQKIEGGRMLDGGYLSESDARGIKLFFDEGTQFVLSPGTRGRLRVADADGVRLGVERGSASLLVTHRPEHRWSVEAGPFVVTVKGTDFSVSWDPASEQFELRLRRGLVTVSGPIIGEGFALRAGQKLSVSLPKSESVIAEERAETAAGERAPVAPPSAAVAAAAPARANGEASAAARSAERSAVSPRTVTERRWRDALADGNWDKILAAAEREGTDSALEKASSDDLFALSDAARYRRRVDLARAALLAQRRRFPSSPRAIDALFLLGRVEELRANGRTPALGYYDEYLSRAPAGTYAAEALGRKMILTKDGAGTESAAAIAEEYLRRFPRGSYAGAARALLEHAPRALP